jgi:hypothetical protein
MIVRLLGEPGFGMSANNNMRKVSVSSLSFNPRFRRKPMATEILPFDFESNDEWNRLRRQYDDMPTRDLWDLTAHTLGLTAAGFAHLAMQVGALERRGEDVTKVALLHHLRKVDCGSMLPQVLARFLGSNKLIGIIGSMAHNVQRELADGAKVPLVVRGDDGTPTHRMVNLLEMLPQQIAQVFARDHIRSESEQILYLDAQREAKAAPVPEIVGPAKIDRERDGAYFGRLFVPTATLERVVRELRKAKR